MQNPFKSVTFIKLSLTNSYAFAEVCNEIQKVHKTSTYSFHLMVERIFIFVLVFGEVLELEFTKLLSL